MFRRTTAAALAALLLVAAACGDDADSRADDVTSTTAASPTFPVTVAADNGAVEIAAAPDRIVSLSASLTEILFAVDAGDQVVAVDSHSDFPEGTPVTELSGFSPNVEAIAGYDPDLVVVSRDRDGLADALGALGIATLVLSSADSLDEVYAEIEVLGDATGHPRAAADLVDEMRTDLRELARSVPDRDAPLPAYVELSDELSSVTSDTFLGELLGLAGLASIGDGADAAAGGYPQLSNEYVISSDPAVILLAHADGSGDVASVAGRAGWDELRAVRGGDVVVLDPDLASRWGPRIVELLRAVIDATSGITG